MGSDGDERAAPTGQYFESDPSIKSRRHHVRLVLPDFTTELVTDRGVFSADRIDVGTRLLLVDGPGLLPSSNRVVDVGCGYGPIAVALAHRAPEAEVWAVDTNQRAVALASENLSAYPKARAINADEMPADLTVDEVWSNPPIRIGKPAMHELLTFWHSRLRANGRMVLVVQKHLGADSLHRWFEAQGWPTERFRASARYRLLVVQATS